MSALVGLIAAVDEDREDDAVELAQVVLAEMTPTRALFSAANLALLLRDHPNVPIQQVAAMSQLERDDAEDQEGADSGDDAIESTSGKTVLGWILDAIEVLLPTDAGEEAERQHAEIVKRIDSLTVLSDGSSAAGLAIRAAASLVTSLRMELFVARGGDGADAAVERAIQLLREQAAE